MDLFSKKSRVALAIYWYLIQPTSWALSARKDQGNPLPEEVLRPTFADLQKCVTPQQMLNDIGAVLDSEYDQEGTLSSTLLVRLSKQAVASDNDYRHHQPSSLGWSVGQSWNKKHLINAVHTLARASLHAPSPVALDAAVEGTKAASVLARLCPAEWSSREEIWHPLIEKWHFVDKSVAFKLQPHHLSSLRWSMDCFQSLSTPAFDASDEDWLPPNIKIAHEALDLPFRLKPSCFSTPSFESMSVSKLAQQVNFRVDNIRTTSSKKVVPERRQTAWEGDEGVAPFDYSGKSMPRDSWSPLVRQVRDRLREMTGIYYDGCLLNLYPDGGSGMRYHIDPDQGKLWGYDTAVISVGATRKFAFRAIHPPENRSNPTGNRGTSNQDASTRLPHIFTLMHGDCTEMFGDCQKRFQHTVKTAETSNDEAPRASLVFKKTWKH